MKQAFLDFPDQFAYQAKIENKKYYKKSKQFIVLGMGGSGLAADIIQSVDPSIKIVTHKDYGLPVMDKNELKNYLIIANSYSGNTAEVLEGAKLAYKQKLNVLAIATGGKLIAWAKKNNLPYIQMPSTGIQPRHGLGFNCRAMLKAMELGKYYKEVGELSKSLHSAHYEKEGIKIAKGLKNKVPVIYASSKNFSLAYNWKIKMNETGKIPAFYNVLPELNHNEMTGFDAQGQTKKLAQNFFFIIIKDETDHPQNKKRMEVISRLYRKRKLPVLGLTLKGRNKWQQIFSNLLIADWTSYHLALYYQVEPEQVPMVEEFKKLI